MTRADRNILARPTDPVPAPRRRAGFSLFELLFVIAIIAIIAAMGMPKYGRSVARYRAECAARRVAADLTLARANARASSTERIITFNTVAGSYTLAGVRHLDHSPTRPYTVALGDAPYHATLYYADFGGAPEARFDMYGNPTWSGKVIVRCGEFEQSVTLSSADGSVTVN